MIILFDYVYERKVNVYYKTGRNFHPAFQDTRILIVTAGHFCSKNSTHYTAKEICMEIATEIENTNFAHSKMNISLHVLVYHSFPTPIA